MLKSGFPKSSKNITVTNPKDIITKALPTISTLQTTLISRRMDLVTSSWWGPTDDLLQVISLPVLIIVQGVNSMAQVKAIGEDEAREKKKNLILEILGILFAFIPFVDVLLPEVEGLEAIIAIVDVAGNAALTIQDIVAHPLSAPMDILGLLTLGGTRYEDDFASMAAKRRGISASDLTKIGTGFKAVDDKL